jgi:hypothetical protein
MIYLYGDSHSRESFKGLLFPHESRTENSVTMHRIGRDKVIVNWKPCNVNDTCIFVYGEVDCRAHIGKQIELGRTEDEVIDTLTKDYIDTIRAIAHCRVIIVAVIPPTARKDYEASVPNGGFPFVSSDEERVRYTKSVNNHLSELCRQNNFVFFDPYEPYTRDDGCLRRELSDGNVHVGDSRYVISQFKRYLITYK